MSRSYTQCSECGKRALSIATRCPGCGRELPRAEVPERRPLRLGRLNSGPALAGLVIVGAILATAWHGHRMAHPGQEESSLVAAPYMAPFGLDTGVSTASLAADSRTATDSSPATPSPAAAPSPGAPVGPATGELLVARTWTHVRAGRSVKTGLTAVLMPGDTVFADSLGRDWYRVALEGEVMGYAHRSTLEPTR
jgi:hypothetical protein